MPETFGVCPSGKTEAAVPLPTGVSSGAEKEGRLQGWHSNANRSLLARQEPLWGRSSQNPEASTPGGAGGGAFTFLTLLSPSPVSGSLCLCKRGSRPGTRTAEQPRNHAAGGSLFPCAVTTVSTQDPPNLPPALLHALDPPEHLSCPWEAGLCLHIARQ